MSAKAASPAGSDSADKSQIVCNKVPDDTPVYKIVVVKERSGEAKDE